MNKKFIMFAIFGMIFLFGMMANVSALTKIQGSYLENGMVAHYSYEESSGTVIDDLSVYNATNNGASYSATGKIGNAYQYVEADRDYITLPSLTTLGTQDFTVSFWVKKSSDASADIAFVSLFGNTEINIGWDLSIDSLNASVTRADNTYYGVTASDLDTNWHMITLVGDRAGGAGAGLMLYVDGSHVANNTGAAWTNLRNPATSNYVMRSGYDSLVGEMDGFLDQLAIFNRTINETEVQDLYNSGNGLGFTETGGITTTLVSPNDNSVVSTTSQAFNVSQSATGATNLVNTTYHVWFTNGTIWDTDTVSISGQSNSTEVNFSGMAETSAFKWNALTCGDDGNCAWATNNKTFYTYIEINIINYEGSHLESANIECTSIGLDTDVTSPYRTGLSTFTSTPPTELNCTFTDLLNYNKQNNTLINFTETQFQYNITMSQKELILNYFYYNSTGASVTGYYSDGNVTGNFTDVNFTKILQDLVQGRVRVLFGWNTSILNYTQYYEYENDWITHTEENLTVLENVDTSAYIKVIDESGNPIDDVLVRVAFSNPQTGGLYKEMGQRFTGSDGTSGMTSFFFDASSDVSIRFSKDGYTAKTIVVDIGANTYTFSAPLYIVLYREETLVHKGVFVRSYNYYNTNMSIIPLSIYAPSRSTVKFTTNYRDSQGLGNSTITLDEFKKGLKNMTRGVDYCSGCTSDLTVTIYIDNEFWGTLTIPFQATNEDLFTEPTGLDDETKIRFAWIALILLAGVGGLLLKGSDESLGAGGHGKNIFFIGALLISILFINSFTFLFIVTLLYGAGLFLRKVIGE